MPEPTPWGHVLVATRYTLVTAAWVLASWVLGVLLVGLVVTAPLLAPLAERSASRERVRVRVLGEPPIAGTPEPRPAGLVAQITAAWSSRRTRRELVWLAAWLVAGLLTFGEINETRIFLELLPICLLAICEFSARAPEVAESGAEPVGA